MKTEDFKVVIDKENNKSIVFKQDNELIFWDAIGGHSSGSIDYYNECTVIEDNQYLNDYLKAYDYTF